MAHLTDAEKDDILRNPEKIRYQLLSRLKADCDQWLGNGNRSDKHLWASEGPAKQIAYMRELWKSFPEDKKPEWLSLDEIDWYAVRMGVSARAVLLPVGEAPQDIVIDFDDKLPQLEKAVGGLVELDWSLESSGIHFFLNKEREQLFLPPNRACYATERLAEENYFLGAFAQDDELVKEDELFEVLAGNAVAVSFDDPLDPDNIASLSKEQVDFIMEEFADPNSGRDAVTAVKALREEGKLNAPNRADIEHVTAALAEAREAAFWDLDIPSELDRHPELTEEDDRPWSLDAEMDRLMEIDAEAFWENADELPFIIGDSRDGDR